jgi:hypothetical protein
MCQTLLGEFGSANRTAVMLHTKPVQQRDQSGPTLILDGAFLLDPCADLARRPRQRFADPGFQIVLLFGARAAGALPS